jgi:POLO box duplicated region
MDKVSKSMNLNKDIPHPTVFITKWIDYTNKYGLSYQLRDGSVGVYFNDTTSIILSADGEYYFALHRHFEYLYYDRSGDRPVMHRRVHSLNSPPQDLSKKITLLKHFKGYMQDNLTKAYIDTAHTRDGNSSKLDFLTKYLRTKSGVLFRLSNQSLQVLFLL